MDLGLAGRTALITGAAGGIGRALAAAFAAEDCRLVLLAHTQIAALRRDWGDAALCLGAQRAFCLQSTDNPTSLSAPAPGRAPREEPNAARCRRTGTDSWACGQLGALLFLSALVSHSSRSP